jgi:hypothetical protein
MSPHASCKVKSNMPSQAETVNRQEQEPMNGSRIHDWVEAVRDTAIMVAFQMILRATLMMRRWNY